MSSLSIPGEAGDFCLRKPPRAGPWSRMDLGLSHSQLPELGEALSVPWGNTGLSCTCPGCGGPAVERGPATPAVLGGAPPERGARPPFPLRLAEERGLFSHPEWETLPECLRLTRHGLKGHEGAFSELLSLIAVP